MELTPPWVSDGQHRICAYEPSNISESIDDLTNETFIMERTRLHEIYIKEKERTKRLYLLLSASLIALAAILPVLAPAGREITSYLVSASILVFCGGAAGYTALTLRTKTAALTAGREHRDKPEEDSN